jgi:hypothetical protein
VKVDLSQVSQSNLGGFGPDSGKAEVRYASAVVVDGHTDVDLVVTSERSSGFEQNLNGVKNGEFGRLSQASGGSYEYNFEFRSGSSFVDVDKFVITFFDVDGNAREEVKESVTVCGASEILLTDNTHLSSKSEGDCTTLEAAMNDGSDHVEHIADLTQMQKSHAFGAVFTRTSRFTVKTSITLSTESRLHSAVENHVLEFTGTPIAGFVPQSVQKDKTHADSCDQLPITAFAGKKVEIEQLSTLHGKATYTYTIEIGGSIWQYASDAGDFHIGEHFSYCGGPEYMEYFSDGDKCGDTPRSATVKYTFGAELKLLSANEPSMCKYEYTIQLPQTDCVVVG